MAPKFDLAWAGVNSVKTPTSGLKGAAVLVMVFWIHDKNDNVVSMRVLYVHSISQLRMLMSCGQYTFSEDAMDLLSSVIREGDLPPDSPHESVALNDPAASVTASYILGDEGNQAESATESSGRKSANPSATRN